MLSVKLSCVHFNDSKRPNHGYTETEILPGSLRWSGLSSELLKGPSITIFSSNFNTNKVFMV